MIKAVIFDLDGSLVDSMWIWRSIDIEYLGRFGIALPERLQEQIEGMSFSETAAYFKERFALPDSLEQIKSDWNQMAWQKYEREVPLKKGVKELLTYCREHDIRLGIATSNSRQLAETVLRAHGLEPYFDCIMTACEVEKGKPAPDIYMAVSEALRIPPAQCLVFEDIVPGILAGQAAGMQVCAVYDQYSAYQDEEKKKQADYYTYEFTELIEKGVFL